MAAQLLSVAQPPPDSPDSPTNTQPELVLLKMLPQVSISVIPGHSGHSSSLLLTHGTFGRIKIHREKIINYDEIVTKTLNSDVNLETGNYAFKV